MNPQPLKLLIIEDSDEDYFTTLRALRRSGVPFEAERCANGAEALAYLSACAPPDVALLDLNLPGIDGREVLRRVRSLERYQALPIVVLTTSADPGDVQTCYQSGANSYLIKPVDLGQFMQMMSAFAHYWTNAITYTRLSAS